MQIPYSRIGARTGPRTVLIASLFAWLAVLSAVAVLPAGSGAREAVPALAFFVAAVFAVGASGYAASGITSRERVFWGILGAGLSLRLAGYAVWLGFSGSVAVQALYAASYALLFSAMLYLATQVARRLVWVTALDAAAIALSFGTLVWLFVLGPTATTASLTEAVLSVAQPALDAGVLYLALVVISAPRKPQWASFLALGFLAFLAACALHLGGAGGWTGVASALGVALLGCGAVYAVSDKTGFEKQQKIAPWRQFMFWFGPLSPAVHLGVLLVWGIYNPPLPAYALAVGAGLMAYFAFRISLVSYINKQSGVEQDVETRRYEQDRILRELHDTVKQGVHGVSLALDSASEAARLGENSVVRDRISRARSAIRETEYRVSQPYDELRSLQGEGAGTVGGGSGAGGAESFLRYRLARFEEYFGIRAHTDLQSPLDALEESEVEAVSRIAAEAFWNVAKHARARNLYLDSRRVGRVVMVRIRDDGRGFDPADPSSGMGLLLMRRRAREVGAELDVVSKPGAGTTVQIRFLKGG